jgi:prophage regulatory protein
MQTLDKTAVLAPLKISARTLENWVQSGQFPPPVRVGKRCYWAQEVVERWYQYAFSAQLSFNPTLGR